MSKTCDSLSLSLSPKALTANIPESLFQQQQVDSDEQSLIGHQRAREAIEFGLSMTVPGFNVFAMGEQGTGRQTLIRQMLNKLALAQDSAKEWCYINNFDDVHAPLKLYLNPGEGKLLLDRIEKLIDDLLDLFPEIFDNPGYQRKKAAIDRAFNHQYDEAIGKVEGIAIKQNIALYEEDGEMTFAPVVDGKPANDQEFAKLSEDERKQFYQLLAELEAELSEQLLELPLWKRKSAEQLRQLKFDTAEQSIRPLIKELEHEFASNIGIIKYLVQVKQNITDVVLDILVNENEEVQDDKVSKKALTEQFLPNLLVSRANDVGAPVVYEQNPTFQNIFGSIDFSNIQGAIYTNYRYIRAGALHKANGGYLLIDAEKLLNQPLVWSRLKLAIKTQEIQVEHPYAEISQSGLYTMSPEKIPLQLKVVLLGDPETYYLLEEYDQEFNELFRVLADFDRHLDKNNDNLIAYGNIIRQRAAKLNYPDITNQTIVYLVRYALRRAEHQHKLSANIVHINDLLDEACFIWKKEGGVGNLEVNFVEKALAAKQRRTGRVSETWLEEIKERQLLISTSGSAIGKVNGLTVLEIGDSVFGTPARITATVYAGTQGVTDIEREVELGRAIHSKGVMLLTGYLGHKYGREFPLSISANLAIEQSYGHIDGDSASMAELCALISAITQIPINQSLAMTGSINQHGEVQSIGGVNEKIEGFYRLCKDTGLTGEQGVIIPKTNMINLMLADDVIQAVTEGQFQVYAVENIDQALELLLGMKAGEISRTGRYPRKSIHGLAMAKLATLSDIINGCEE